MTSSTPKDCRQLNMTLPVSLYDHLAAYAFANKVSLHEAARKAISEHTGFGKFTYEVKAVEAKPVTEAK